MGASFLSVSLKQYEKSTSELHNYFPYAIHILTTLVVTLAEHPQVMWCLLFVTVIWEFEEPAHKVRRMVLNTN